MKTQLKDILREIKKSRNRFLSILAIVAIGSGFFVGVKVTCPDMEWTAENYFRDQHLMDVQLKSTMGFTDADIAALAQDQDVQQVSAAYSADAFVSASGGSNNIVRTHSVDLEELKNGEGLNRPVLKEGRWPENETECLVEEGLFTQGAYHIGSAITLHRGEEDVNDTFVQDTFTVVGIVESPMYISFERGSSNIGNGQIDTYMLIPKKAYAYEVYTDVFMTLKDMAPFYDNAYEERVSVVLDRLEGLADQREDIRFRQIHEEASVQMDDAKTELTEAWASYNQAKAEFDAEIADGESKLAVAQKELEYGQKAYDQGLSALNQGKQELVQGENALALAGEQLTQKQEELEQAKAQLNQLEQSVQAIGNAVANDAYVATGTDLPDQLRQVLMAAQVLEQSGGASGMSVRLEQFFRLLPGDLQKDQLGQGILAGLAPVEQQLAAGKKEVADGQQQLDQAMSEWQKGNAELADNKRLLAEKEAELSSAKTELDRGRRALEVSLAQLEEGKKTGEAQLAEAKTKLEQGQQEYDDGEAELNKLEKPDWYLFDRSNNPGYSGYLDDAARVDKIAAVFPLFFILVAGLVCLTTMTRMVEEKRTEIGTEKALGYSKRIIMIKYLVYAATASLLGCIIGLAVGFKLFPIVIFNAYRIMYIMPALLAPVRWDYALFCTGVAVLCTCLAAFFACYKELRGCPAKMMRPKPPKIGKRVLLEKITVIWKRLSFLQKVTARNLFRYKKRIFMTIIGIAGCTALLLTGFGLQHSIASIVDKQYGDIFHYDVLGVYDEDIKPADRQQVMDDVHENAYLTDAIMIRQQSLDVSRNGVKKNIYLIVPQSPEDIGSYITLQERRSGKPITIPQKGAVITEKISRLLDLQVGQEITLHLNDGRESRVPVSAITENYTMNYLYLSPEQYTESFGQPVTNNAFFANMDEVSNRDALSEELLKNKHILALNFSEDNGQQFTDVVGSMDYIVLVIILSAGALAFVVLYNLSNINITERVREIATIKVLGFYDGEVSKYVNRENTLASLLGTIIGLFLGIPFEWFVVQTAEMDAVMFVPGINFLSFVLAVCLTMIFTLIVNYTMTFVLRKVDMVESLKSVE